LNLLKEYPPLLTILITVVLGVPNLVFTIRRDKREVRKETAERLQQESAKFKNDAYPRRKDRHHKR
jgi:hypothetical protein